MRGKVLLPLIFTVAALLFCVPVYAQGGQRTGCLVTATVEEIGETAEDGEPSPAPPPTPSQPPGDETVIGPPGPDSGFFTFLGVDIRSVGCLLMLLLFFLLLLLILCLIAWLVLRKMERERQDGGEDPDGWEE